MSNFKDDKTETFEFRPVRDEKPQIRRSENDEYSAARKNDNYEKREEKSSKGLVYVAIILAVLLIAAIVAGIFILKPEKQEEPPVEENITVNLPEEEEEKEEEEVKNITVSCSMVFYSDSVIKKNGGYTVLADLYDSEFYKFDNRKLTINEDTDIRESGKRLSAEALIYLIESMGGEGIVFDGEIKEEDGTVLSISFDGGFREELEKEEEENPSEGEVISPEEETPSESPSTEEPTGENENNENAPSNQADGI